MSDGVGAHSPEQLGGIQESMTWEGDMRLFTLQFCLVGAALLSWGCGSASNAASAGSSSEMTRVQTAFEELQKVSGTGASISRQEFTQQVEDTLAKIGDLGNSEKTAGLGLPQDKVAIVYGYFQQVAIAYALSTQFAGAGIDAQSRRPTDLTSDGERQSLNAAFPELDGVDVMYRGRTLYDLLQIAHDQTHNAGEMIKTL
jgi:hypothetical protein